MDALPLPERVRVLGRVLSADEATLYHDAAGALAAARQDADRLRETALNSAADIRRAAEAEGRAQGEAAAARLLAGTASRTLCMLDAMRDAIAQAIAAGVAQVIGTLDLDTAAAAAAAHAVAQLRERARIVVRVAPARVDAVRASLAPWGEACRLEPDTTLGPDDCTIETEAGFMRAGLAAQLEVLREALVRGPRTSSVTQAPT
jgi:type III secretion protein L